MCQAPRSGHCDTQDGAQSGEDKHQQPTSANAKMRVPPRGPRKGEFNPSQELEMTSRDIQKRSSQPQAKKGQEGGPGTILNAVTKLYDIWGTTRALRYQDLRHEA